MVKIGDEMIIKHIQTVVVEEDYKKIARAAFDEELTLSNFIKKVILNYIEKGGGKDEIEDGVA